MTIVAIVAAGDVRRVFAGRRDAVMAGAAGAYYLGVVDGDDGLKRNGAVAVLADVTCLHVSRTLTGGSDAIVATDAVADDACVIEHGREPCSGAVAIVALIVGGNMTRRFSRRLNPIVAADTASCNRRVIHERDHCPIRCYVAVRAFARRCNVGCRF